MDIDTLREIRSIVDEVDTHISLNMPGNDFYPTDHAAVITKKSGKLWLEEQKWGYSGVNKSGVIFNARAESVLEKRIFQNGIRYHRIIVPAKKFYEWNRKKEKNTFFRMDGEPLFFAGFCDMIENEKRFVILTTKANASMEKVHERMPLLLEKDQINLWFDDSKSAEEILSQEPVMLQREAEYEQLSFF